MKNFSLLQFSQLFILYSSWITFFLFLFILSKFFLIFLLWYKGFNFFLFRINMIFLLYFLFLVIHIFRECCFVVAWQSANNTLFLLHFNVWHFPLLGKCFSFCSCCTRNIVLFDRLNIYLWYRTLWRCGIYSVIWNYVIIKI